MYNGASRCPSPAEEPRVPAPFPYPPLWETFAQRPASSKARAALAPPTWLERGGACPGLDPGVRGLPVSVHAPAPAYGRQRPRGAALFTLSKGRGRFGRLRPKSVRGLPGNQPHATPSVLSALTSHYLYVPVSLGLAKVTARGRDRPIASWSLETVGEQGRPGPDAGAEPEQLPGPSGREPASARRGAEPASSEGTGWLRQRM